MASNEFHLNSDTHRGSGWRNAIFLKRENWQQNADFWTSCEEQQNKNIVHKSRDFTHLSLKQIWQKPVINVRSLHKRENVMRVRWCWCEREEGKRQEKQRCLTCRHILFAQSSTTVCCVKFVKRKGKNNREKKSKIKKYISSWDFFIYFDGKIVRSLTAVNRKKKWLSSNDWTES